MALNGDDLDMPNLLDEESGLVSDPCFTCIAAQMPSLGDAECFFCVHELRQVRTG